MSVKKPKLSVIIPIKNTRHYSRGIARLKNCLRSLENQTTKNFEVIIVDLDSDAYYRRKHQETAKRFGVRYVYSRTGCRWNISRARNIGIRKARGSFVMSTDVDCIFHPEFMAKALTLARKSRILHCRIWDLPEDYNGPLDDFEAMRKASVLRPPYCYGGCQVVDRGWAVSVSGYDESYVHWGADDEDLYQRAKKAGLENLWIEDEAEYYHQYHPQDNRQEDLAQVEQNRRRLTNTKQGLLPTKRNPFGWGEIKKTPFLNDTAVLITTFLRDDHLFRSIESVRQYYPSIKIFIADNGKKPTKKKKEFCGRHKCRLVKVPFDSGVGASRNAVFKVLPRQVKYVVIIEDDIRFTPSTVLSAWRNLLEHKKEIGIVGCLLNVNTHIGRAEQHFESLLELKNKTLHIKKIDKFDWTYFRNLRYVLCDMTLNCFMMRRKIWGEVQWDEQIKTAPEHEEYFLAIKEKTEWKVAYTDNLSLDHLKEADKENYANYRKRMEGFYILGKKWKIDKIDSEYHQQYGIENPLYLKRRSKPPAKSQEKIKGRGVIAIGIKTFMRDGALWRAIKSIEDNAKLPYRLYIADDGRISPEKEYKYRELEHQGHRVFRMPFGAGISMGRNKIVSEAQEKLVFIMDDDLAFISSATMSQMMAVLNDDPDIGIAAGVLKNETTHDYFGNRGYARGVNFEIKNGLLFRDTSNGEIQETKEGVRYVMADQVVNFFLARKEMFNDIQWDNRIKVEYEHMDFFLRLQQTRWKAAVCLDAEAIHMYTVQDSLYRQHRWSRPIAYFKAKHGIHDVINRF